MNSKKELEESIIEMISDYGEKKIEQGRQETLKEVWKEFNKGNEAWDYFEKWLEKEVKK